MSTYFLLLVKRENKEYDTMIGYTEKYDLENIKSLVLGNINHCNVNEIISHKIINKDVYDDMSETYIVYDIGNIDFIHIDNERLQFSFVKKVIEKTLNNRYIEDRKYQIHRPALECFPIQNRTMSYYLKVYIEHILKPVIKPDVEFKFIFFNINVVRDLRIWSGFIYAFDFILTLKKDDKFFSYKGLISNTVDDYETHDLENKLKYCTDSTFEGYEYILNNPYIDTTYMENPVNFLKGTNNDSLKSFIGEEDKREDVKCMDINDILDTDFSSDKLFVPFVDEINKTEMLLACQYRESIY
tara:strand:+ start:2801 stop:3697 length:897 start_codon:yes stop_codon:yes gene_type:complete